MEQSINREAKSQGGVIGFALRKGALLRWLMTRHITGEYAEAFKDLCKSSSKDKLHDELGGTRLYRDAFRSVKPRCEGRKSHNRILDKLLPRSIQP